MNKQYKKEVKFVFLPTNKSCLAFVDGELQLSGEATLFAKSVTIHPAHIYILSDSKPKFGQWVYSVRGFIGRYAEFENSYEEECKPILSSTDPLLSELPYKVSDTFIEMLMKCDVTSKILLMDIEDLHCSKDIECACTTDEQFSCKAIQANQDLLETKPVLDNDGCLILSFVEDEIRLENVNLETVKFMNKEPLAFLCNFALRKLSKEQFAALRRWANSYGEDNYHWSDEDMRKAAEAGQLMERGFFQMQFDNWFKGYKELKLKINEAKEI